MTEQIKCPFCGTSYNKIEVTKDNYKCIICGHWIRREGKWVDNPFKGTKEVHHETKPIPQSEKRNILQVDRGEVVAKYSTPSEAAMMVNGNAVGVQRCLDGLQQTHAGFSWSYE